MAGVPRDDSSFANVVNTASYHLARLGRVFRNVLRWSVEDSGDAVCLGRHIVFNYIAVHVTTFERKFAVLNHMAKKLTRLVHGQCCTDNTDSLCHHEVLLPGCLISRYLKEKVEEALIQVISHLRRKRIVLRNDDVIQELTQLLDRYGSAIGSKVESLLATGNLVSSTGLDLQQSSGFAVVAERLNMWRYLSHFQAVHRGQFFTTMKTTDVRKLLPEAWGFMCPVHTPDGAPCGLLSHLASGVVVSGVNDSTDMRRNVTNCLVSLGVAPWLNNGHELRAASALVNGKASPANHNTIPVLLDGSVVGFASLAGCELVSELLRYLRCTRSGLWPVDKALEVAFIRSGTPGISPFSSLYILTHPARMLRPTLRRSSDWLLSYIGPLEQTTLKVTATPDLTGRVCHASITSSWVCSSQVELSETYILSILASCTPFSDFNQSPRNMYQCQMGKQTMGTPCHAWRYRCDNKLYRLTTPQSPLVRTHAYDSLGLDAFAQGINSIVAVISYTGYDMEDAMILSLSSYQRGYAHGNVYKTTVVDLDVEAKKIGPGQEQRVLHFDHTIEGLSDGPTDGQDNSVIMAQTSTGMGLPDVGQMIRRGDTLWSAYDGRSHRSTSIQDESEPAFVESIRLIGYGYIRRSPF